MNTLFLAKTFFQAKIHAMLDESANAHMDCSDLMFINQFDKTTSIFHCLNFNLAQVPGELGSPVENEFLVSKETMVLRRWERSKQKFGFIKQI